MTKKNINSDFLSMTEILDYLSEKIPVDIPFSFFGTCLGSIVSYELTKRFIAENRPLPEHLFVATCAAPHLYPIAIRDTVEITDMFNQQNGLPQLGRDFTVQEYIDASNVNVSDDNIGYFIKTMEMVGFKNMDMLVNREDMVYTFIPRLRNDMIIAVSYTFNDTAMKPFNIPITAFEGHDDPTIRPGFMSAWQIHTTNQFELISLPGGHYLVDEHYGAIIRNLIQKLSIKRVS